MAGEENDTEELFEKALDLADTHMDQAMAKAGDLAPYVAVAMIEAAVNRAVDATSAEDVISILQDLIQQIEDDMDAEDAGGTVLNS